MPRTRGGTRGRGARNHFDQHRFSSLENQEWFNSREHCQLIIERSPDDFILSNFPIRALFDTLGWAPLLYLSGPYYPTLVKEFFANVENKKTKGDEELHSYVRGIHIVLNRDNLASILGVSNIGPSFRMGKELILSDISYQQKQAASTLGIAPHQKGDGKRVYYNKDLDVLHRLIVYILSYNVIPRQSSLNELRFSDIYFVYKIVTGLGNITGIPFSSIVLSHIRDVVRVQDRRSFCYPNILSRVFQAFQVPLDGVPVETTDATHIITESTLNNLRYVQEGQSWRRLRDNEPRPSRHSQLEDMEEEEEDNAIEEGPSTAPRDVPSSSSNPPQNPEVMAYLRDIRDHQIQMQGQLDEILRHLNLR